jgi:hypothetical protein
VAYAVPAPASGAFTVSWLVFKSTATQLYDITHFVETTIPRTWQLAGNSRTEFQQIAINNSARLATVENNLIFSPIKCSRNICKLWAPNPCQGWKDPSLVGSGSFGSDPDPWKRATVRQFARRQTLCLTRGFICPLLQLTLLSSLGLISASTRLVRGLAILFCCKSTKKTRFSLYSIVYTLYLTASKEITT